MTAEAADGAQRVSEAVVASFLRTHGYTDTLATFERECGRTYDTGPCDLRTLAEQVASLALARAGETAARQATATSASESAMQWPTYELAKTYNHLHMSNILSVRPATYPGSTASCIATTSADRRVVFTDVSNGEVLGVLEKSARGDGPSGHDAAVLDLSQHPQCPRFALTAGMDGRVVQWDLTTDSPVHEMRDHTRFVVRVSHSDDGRFMATAGYDKRIHIYAVDVRDGRPMYMRLHSLTLPTNPEALLFVPGPMTPGHASSDERLWLVYTARDRVVLHYVALPIGREAPGTPDWSVLAYNTNADPDDEHVSYSLLHLSVHPSGRYIAAQTGDHNVPSGSDSDSPSLSRILLMPLFSAHRHATLWTSAPTSAYASPRHAWMPHGQGVWVTGDDGVLRLVSLDGTLRAIVRCHGAAPDAAPGRVGEALAAAAWRSGGNTLVKGVTVLPDGRIASCGFDRTVRILQAL
ncbi:hypothetical protein MNAN1_001460 [Malassezia nana]|uniref:Uncharacterized protein n=1 Tax=Malassezia nana TaxID=180528 RepID=A0AAF0EQQ8_9BASI|nr:hypothetical protein MNAN1_001460 [Malassezia nana]